MKQISAIAAAVILLSTSASFAQQYPSRQSNENAYQNGPQQGRNDNQQGRDQNRNEQGATPYQSQNSNDVRDNPHWSRGDRLSSEYRDSRYVVSDWKNEHLRKPPGGYHWVRTNNQYVLAAVATGLISDIMAANQQDRRSR
jgi:Ni/Co efflux regulator RcnB